MADFFRELIDELQLISSGDEFYGERDGQPLILTYLDAVPPAIMFHVRLDTENQQDLQIPESLSELSEPGDIKVSIENGYGWLIIYNVDDREVGDIIGMLDLFLRVLADNQLSLDKRCSLCRGDEDVQICYTAGKINRICGRCANLAEQKLIEKEKELSKRKYIYSALIPVGIVFFALGWVLLWFVYDWCFSFSDTDTIQVDEIVLFVVSIIVGVILGLPEAFLLKKLSIQNNVLLSIISSVVVLAGGVLGEIIRTVIDIYREYGVISVKVAIKLLKFFLEYNSEGVVIMKVVIVISAIVLIFLVAKAKKTEIDL